MQLRTNIQSLFPIALMLLLVGLTIWLQQATTLQENYRDDLLRHDPDYIVENFTVRRFSPTGGLQSMLTAKKMVHFPDDDTTVASEPHITYLKGGVTRLTAHEGLLAPDAREVVLVGDVRGVREATANKAEIVFTTTRLTVFPDDEIARTTAPVTITQGASIVRGIGMESDGKSQIYQLLNQVTSTIEKKPAR